ncbi:pyridoxamine 5'-phosphate oxidase family protein [Georgenia sp. MJ206]|uniref:pyridoxamine 5'-phosphate oxidase family protein n=1 Tax=Georgenia wangjunii TaxID=3117730 RepID=UPI002F25F4FC
MADPVAELPYMPDYGVRAETWRPLPWSWAATRLSGGRNYWLVTVSAAGRPHALPVWGVWDEEDRRFAFSCGPRSREARNVAVNPQVVVATDDTVECVSLEGRAEVVTDDACREQWAHRYVAKYRPLSPEISADFVLAHVVVEVTPERVLSVIERDDDFATRPTRWRFTAGPSDD